MGEVIEFSRGRGRAQAPCQIEHRALALYVLAGAPGRAGEFLETLSEITSVPVLEFLQLLLTTDNPDQSEENRVRNRLVAPVVAGRLRQLEARALAERPPQ